MPDAVPPPAPDAVVPVPDIAPVPDDVPPAPEPMEPLPDDMAPLPVSLPVPVDGEGDTEMLVVGLVALLPVVFCASSLWQPADRTSDISAKETKHRFFIYRTPDRYGMRL
jgi:hypothetical protein